MQLQGRSTWFLLIVYLSTICFRAELLKINQLHRNSLDTIVNQIVQTSTNVTQRLSRKRKHVRSVMSSNVISLCCAQTSVMTWRWQDGGNNHQTCHQQCEVPVLLGWHSDLPPPHNTPAIVENKQGFQNQPSGRTRDQTWNCTERGIGNLTIRMLETALQWVSLDREEQF